MDPIIIVGSGYAGYSVAREFRRRDKTTPLLLLTADEGEFYSKPALSEAFADGRSALDLVNKTAEQMAAQIKAQVRTGTRVTRIDPARRIIEAGGVELAYRKLVLALGADTIRLALTEGKESHVFSVNDLDDYACFSGMLKHAKSITILGAGLIGCEYADHLNQAGFQVDVIDMAERPLARLLPAANSEYFRQALANQGVRWHLGTSATAIDIIGAQVQVRCANGDAWNSDLVLSAIGLRPRTGLAHNAQLAVGRGITVDQRLRTSDPDIYALGDCAEVMGHLLPYIAPISLAAKVVAANLAGVETTVTYPAMPVTVKTPTCPTMACPPAEGKAGRWDCSASEAGMQALFYPADMELGGFALHGDQVAGASALAQRLPALIA